MLLLVYNHVRFTLLMNLFLQETFPSTHEKTFSLLISLTFLFRIDEQIRILLKTTEKGCLCISFLTDTKKSRFRPVYSLFLIKLQQSIYLAHKELSLDSMVCSLKLKTCRGKSFINSIGRLSMMKVFHYKLIHV